MGFAEWSALPAVDPHAAVDVVLAIVGVHKHDGSTFRTTALWDPFKDCNLITSLKTLGQLLLALVVPVRGTHVRVH
jgi:hypothetical protein